MKDHSSDTVYTVAWSPDGNYLAVGGFINSSTGDDLYLYCFDQGTQTLQQVDSINPGGWIQSDEVALLLLGLPMGNILQLVADINWHNEG